MIFDGVFFMKTYLVTGGCGFIGSNFINYLIKNQLAGRIINLDKLTPAASQIIYL